MKKKRKKKLGRDAQALAAMGHTMIGEVLAQGGIPEMVIAAKPGPGEGQLDYFVASPLPAAKVKYIITRIAGLMSGDIARNN